MKGFLRWLTGPAVLPLVARLALVALTAILAEPVVAPLPSEAPALALGLLGEVAAKRSAS